MPAAWRRMIVPAVRKFGETKADDKSVTLLDCSFCSSDPTLVSCCEFVTGFVQGLLDAGLYTKGTKVHEVGCKSKGAQGCSFIIDQ
jgi:predicted hydrocarbon binding protein